MEAGIKRRVIRLDDFSDPSAAERVAANLAGLPGVKSADANPREGTVTVTYDLHDIELADIEGRISESGVQLDQSVLPRMRRRLIHVLEHNERGNLTTEPRPCCGG